MLWIPRKGRLLVQHNTGTVGETGTGTLITTGASSSTKGTAVEIFSGTSFDSYWVRIVASGLGNVTTASEGCLDILTGAATEEVLIPNLLCGYAGNMTGGVDHGAKCWEFPLYVPAGSRIAAQAASARTSTAMRVAVFLYGGLGYPPWRVGSKVTTYGIGTVPNGTSITAGEVGAEGSWTQVTAATSEDHFAWVPSHQFSTETDLNDQHLALDIGTGSATEEEILQTCWFAGSARETESGPSNAMPCFHDVPSGARMVMRVSTSAGSTEVANVALHAVS